MVQLKDETVDEPENINQKTVYREPSPWWPYVLLAVAVLLLSVGIHHFQKAASQGKCPFHYNSWDSVKDVPNPHLPPSPEDTSLPPSPEHTSPSAPGTLPRGYDKSQFTEELVYGSKKILAGVYSGRVITKQELAQHGPSSDYPWVGVLGHVYDVSVGRRLYGGDGTYSFFTGRDGSRAYSTGQFDEAGLTDEISDMSVEQIGEIFHWINIFSKKYPIIGRIEGPFFTSGGIPTSQWRFVEDSLRRLGELETSKAEIKRKYPSCNSHYDGGAGKAEVWCTEKSGGVVRDWSGVPRQLHLPGERIRCACIPDSLLSDPKLKEYPDCALDAKSCKITI